MYLESNDRIKGEATSTTNAGIDITFQNIRYDVAVQVETDKCQFPCCKEKQVKQILKGLSGIAKSGQSTAIMGASGAGKTTLLNILACRIPRQENMVGYASGKVCANTLEYKFEEFGEFANYVMQDDILLQTLTVRETIEYVSQLKLNLPQDERKIKTEELIKNLKLEKCAETLVGGQIIKGISGGERKRTSIAFELVSNPSVIILDEPTSGLDSLTAYIICSYLGKLAKEENKTVIMTIHQPGAELFNLFDRLILLAEGEMVYQGKTKDTIEYFDQMGFTCPDFMNPPDYFMSILHHQSSVNVENYPKYFDSYNTKLMPAVTKEIEEKKKTVPESRPHDVSFCQGLTAILKRDWINTLRNPMVVKARIIQTVVLGLLTAGVYYDMQTEFDPPNPFTNPIYQNIQFNTLKGFFFFITMMALMMSLTSITLVFPRQRVVFLKQEGSKLYSTFTFFLSRNIIQLPFLILIPMILTLILYWMVGLEETAQQFFTFYFAVFLINFAGSSLGLFLGSVAKDAKLVVLLVPICVLPFVLFSGFFKNREDLPVWLGWLEYLSPIKYTYIMFIRNQLHEESQQDYVDSLSFELQLWDAAYILIGLCIAFRILSLFFLYMGRQKLQ